MKEKNYTGFFFLRDIMDAIHFMKLFTLAIKRHIEAIWTGLGGGRGGVFVDIFKKDSVYSHDI